MAIGATPITITGNLVADPELKYTNSGQAVANMRVCSTEKVYRNGNWEDGDQLFLNVTAWKQLAENAAESLRKGSRVTVAGNLKQRSYENRDGERRTFYEVQAEEVSASLLFNTVQIGSGNRPANNNSSGGGWNSGHEKPQAPQGDPWNSTAGKFPEHDEPPF